MPTSPAFSLLDQAPTVIDRPTSARALAVGLYQSLDQKAGLPTNYAAEFTPFWFVRHPTMSPYRYYGTNAAGTQTTTGPQPLRLSLSLAFINPAVPTTTTTSTNQTASFSLGGRFSLLKVTRKSDLDTFKVRTARIVARLRTTLADLNQAVPLSLAATDSAEYRRRVAAFYKARTATANAEPAYQATKNTLAEVLSHKPLASVDIASASSWYFPDRTFSSNQLGRTGVWLTGNVAAQFNQKATSKKGYFSLYVLGRWMADRTLTDINNASYYLDISYLDGGGKSELELNNLTLSYELVARRVLGADKEKNPAVGNGWRSVGNIKYKIGPTTYITGAFGKNFGKRDNLLFALGINWNISTGNEQATVVP